VGVVSHEGSLQAYHAAAAAAAAGAAATAGGNLPDGPAVCYKGNSKYAVKVYYSSIEGASETRVREVAARELHALQTLRGGTQAVQVMAEGKLEFMGGVASSGCAATSAAAVSGAAAGRSSTGGYQLRCVVMELVDRTLQDVMHHMQRKGIRSEEFAHMVADDVLLLLQLTHSGQLGYFITHRDLKPANILWRADDTPAVADFSACHIRAVAGEASGAAAAAAGAAAGSMHTAIGSHFYAAPEVWVPAASPQPSSSTAQFGGLDSQQSGNAFAFSGTQHSAAGLASTQQSGNKLTGGGLPSYNASIDVFAVGVIVLEVLAGSLGSLFGPGELTTAQMMQQWEQQLGRLVHGEALPNGVVLSPAARQFIGCCCGVGREREAAAARGEPKRLTPAELRGLPFIESWVMSDMVPEPQAAT
jgi:serine/threonine protein kinase